MKIMITIVVTIFTKIKQNRIMKKNQNKMMKKVNKIGKRNKISV